MMNNFVSEFSPARVSGVAHIVSLVRRLPLSRLHIRIRALPIAEPLLERIGGVCLTQARAVHDVSGFVVDESYADDSARVVAPQKEVDTVGSQAFAQSLLRRRLAQCFLDFAPKLLPFAAFLESFCTTCHVPLQLLESDRFPEHRGFERSGDSFVAVLVQDRVEQSSVRCAVAFAAHLLHTDIIE